ncbi:MAG: dienelactone hydrolase family protein [Pseudomonadota bacterium]
MVNIKLLKLIFILLSFIGTHACATGSGSYSHLGNNGKKFTSASKMSSKDWNNPQELERVWQASFIRIPLADGGVLKSTIADLIPKQIDNAKKYPTVVYMHGCSGFWSGTMHRIDFLAQNGFAVIAPPSFARKRYPKSCDINLVQGGLYRDTIKMRQNDAGYAIKHAKDLPWVDKNNVFLMGLSEGGITTATFYAKDESKSVNARVVEGWTCTSTWDEYSGVRAPKTEPVLTLLGDKDPWFQNPYTNGECTRFLNEKNGSKSIVYRKGNLSYRHELLEDDMVKKSVIHFLQQHLK